MDGINVFLIYLRSIPTDLDLCIPSAQDKLFNWVNNLKSFNKVENVMGYL